MVQPRDGSTGKKTKSDEYVFDPLNLVTVEVLVLRGQQFETRDTRYCYLTRYNITALALHDAVVLSRSFFDIQNWVSCVGCESGNASSAEAGPACESGNASSAQTGPTHFHSSGVVQRGIDHSPGPATQRVRKALAQKLSKAANTSPSSDWAASGSAAEPAAGPPAAAEPPATRPQYRCWVCGTWFYDGVKSVHRDCMHRACCGDHIHILNLRWIDIRAEFEEMEDRVIQMAAEASAAPGSAFGGAPGYGSPRDLQIMNPRALENLHVFRPQGLAFSVHAVGQVIDLQTYSLSILFLKGDA